MILHDRALAHMVLPDALKPEKCCIQDQRQQQQQKDDDSREKPQPFLRLHPAGTTSLVGSNVAYYGSLMGSLLSAALRPPLVQAACSCFSAYAPQLSPDK